MLKKSRDEFTVSELNILRLLWTEQTSLSGSQILEHLPELHLFSTSIYTILNGMVDKGLLTVDGKIKRGKRFARTFKPTIRQEEFAAMQALKLTSNLHKNDRLVGVFTAMVEQDGITAESLSALEEFLQKKRKELGL